MKSLRRAVAAALLAWSGCATPPSAPVTSLEGSWTLVAMDLLAPDGSVRSLGAQESFFLFAGESYSMTWAFGATAAPAFAHRWHPTDAEKLARFSSTLVNAGTFHVVGDTLVVQPRFSLAPDFVNGEGRFTVSFKGDTLVLSWHESLGFDGLPYPGGGVVTLLRLVRADAPSRGDAPVRAAGRIAFYSDRDGNPEIYVMDADGASPSRVTRHPAFDVAPALSPDGSRVAFLTARHDPDGTAPDFVWEVYVADVDGGEERRLTHNGHAEDHLAWSPDGLRLSYTTDSDGDGFQEVWVMDADGSDPLRLTHGAANDQWASWSPDGARIVFTSDRAGGLDLWVMGTDGTGATRLTGDPRPEIFPEWSPTGERIAFMVLDGGPTLWTVQTDGSDPTPLMNRRAEGPAWSPDGRSLAFQDWDNGRMEIYRLTLDTGEIVNLTRNPANDFWASWR